MEIDIKELQLLPGNDVALDDIILGKCTKSCSTTCLATCALTS
jgi:hypothetical protein